MKRWIGAVATLVLAPATLLPGCAAEVGEPEAENEVYEKTTQEISFASPLVVWNVNAHAGQAGYEFRNFLHYTVVGAPFYPDLILLQEVSNTYNPGNWTCNQILGYLQGYSAHDNFACTNNTAYRGGVAIIYRTSRLVLLSNNIDVPMYDTACNTLCTGDCMKSQLARFQGEGGRIINVFNAHMPNNQTCGLANAQRARSLVTKLGSYNIRIIGGDFNVEDRESNGAWKTWYADTLNAGWSDIVYDYYAGNASNILTNAWTAQRTDGSKKRIDFLFTGSALSRTYGGTLAWGDPAMKMVSALPYSDHRAIGGRFDY